MSTYISNLGVSDYVKVYSLYTGTDLNGSCSGVGGTYTHNVELTTVDSSEILTKTYAIITVTGYYSVNNGSGTGASTNLLIERSSAIGAYSTAGSYTPVNLGNATGEGTKVSMTIQTPITLTAEEINNGLKIKITASGSTSGTGCGSSSTIYGCWISAYK